MKWNIEIWNDVSLRLILKDKGFNRHYCLAICWSWVWGIPKKERATEKEGADIENWDTSAHLYWGFKKTSCRTWLLLHFMGTNKRTTYESSIFLLLICLEEGKVLEVALLGRRQMTDLGEEKVYFWVRGVGENYTD